MVIAHRRGSRFAANFLPSLSEAPGDPGRHGWGKDSCLCPWHRTHSAVTSPVSEKPNPLQTSGMFLQDSWLSSLNTSRLDLSCGDLKYVKTIPGPFFFFFFF